MEHTAWLWILAVCVPPVIQGGMYKAAVLEYGSTGDIYTQTPAEVLINNLAQYSQYIEQAGLSGVDIVVFPEYGLSTLGLSSLSRLKARPFLQRLPAINASTPEDQCGQMIDSHLRVSVDQLVFTTLSCRARQHSVYVVANVGEIIPCNPGENETNNEPCPSDGAFQYNSNIVFDRSGRLIARYRKTKLFLEPLFQEPVVPDHVTFTTDFGVKFGVLTCFDIMYYEPGLYLYYEKNIRDFVIPMAWVDELPFLTAVQIQEGWSRFLGVNLLSSGYHLPSNGQLGSGIFTPNGPVNYTFSPDSRTRLIIAKVGFPAEESTASSVPIHTCNNDLFYFEDQDRWMAPHEIIYEDLTGYSNLELKTGLDKSASVCHGELCCSVNYSSVCLEENCDAFRLFGYSGSRTVGAGMYTIWIQLCAVVACSDQDVKSCAGPDVDRTAIFEYLHLSGNFSSARHVYPTANSVTNLQLLPFGSLKLDVRDNGTVKLLSTRILDDVMTIGLYGRDYEKDVN